MIPSQATLSELQFASIFPGIGFIPVAKKKRGRPPITSPSSRDLEMEKLFNEGKTFHEIGIRYGLTRERVRQIFCHKFHKTAKDNAQRATIVTFNKYNRAKSDKLNSKENKQLKIAAIFGCSEEILISINDGAPWKRKGEGIANAYYNQRHNARRRRIEWNITLPEWWRVWEESRKYQSRGRGKDCYVMARYGDSGSYEIGNVYICSLAQNSSDQYLIRDARRNWRKKFCKRGHLLAEHGKEYGKKQKHLRCQVCMRAYWIAQYYKKCAAPILGAGI